MIVRGIKDRYDYAVEASTGCGRGVEDLRSRSRSRIDAHDLLNLYAHGLVVRRPEFAQAVPHDSYYFHEIDNRVEDVEAVQGAIRGLIEAFLAPGIRRSGSRLPGPGIVVSWRRHARRLACTTTTDVFFLDPFGEIFRVTGGTSHRDSARHVVRGDLGRRASSRGASRGHELLEALLDDRYRRAGDAAAPAGRRLVGVAQQGARGPRSAGRHRGLTLRIAHIGSKGIPSRGGTERVVEAIATRQATDHEVTVYGSRLVCQSGTYRGVTVRAFPTGHWKHAGPVALQTQCALHAALLGDFDVVHLHGQENAFVLPFLLPRYPVISTQHSPPYLREKWSPLAKAAMRSVEGWSVRLPMIATAVASTQAAELSRRHGVEVLHVPNGVDPDEPVNEQSARAFLAQRGLEPHGYWMFAAARVDPTKGAQDLVRACREIGDCPPLLVLGDLYHAPGFEEELRSLAKGSDVRFVPRLDDKADGAGVGAIGRDLRLSFAARGHVDDASRSSLGRHSDPGERYPREPRRAYRGRVDVQGGRRRRPGRRVVAPPGSGPNDPQREERGATPLGP